VKYPGYGMAMMGAMKDGAESRRQLSGSKCSKLRMDMCQSMMQMMMDRMPEPAK
jgi:hypothetical protein